MPKFLVLHNSTSYSYVGNLTFEEIESQILSKEFIQIAKDADIKKDLDGITLDNFLKHPSQQIRTRYPIDYGFKKNLELILKKNTA